MGQVIEKKLPENGFCRGGPKGTIIVGKGMMTTLGVGAGCMLKLENWKRGKMCMYIGMFRIYNMNHVFTIQII